MVDCHYAATPVDNNNEPNSEEIIEEKYPNCRKFNLSGYMYKTSYNRPRAT